MTQNADSVACCTIHVRLKDGSLVEAKHYGECLIGGLDWPVCALAAEAVHPECVQVVRVIEPATVAHIDSSSTHVD